MNRQIREGLNLVLFGVMPVCILVLVASIKRLGPMRSSSMVQTVRAELADTRPALLDSRAFFTILVYA